MVESTSLLTRRAGLDCRSVGSNPTLSANAVSENDTYALVGVGAGHEMLTHYYDCKRSQVLNFSRDVSA